METSVATEAVRVTAPLADPAPVVFDSPHSGAQYPDDFGTVLSLEMLRRAEDRFVDELFALAPEHGATLVAAPVARTYIDLNRTVDDLDQDLMEADWPEALNPGPGSRRGYGLIWRTLEPDHALYDRKLSAAEVQARIDTYWRAYYDALDTALAAARERFGAAWHVNCHSMRAIGGPSAPDPGRVRPDMVLGDLDGASCAPEFTALVRNCLQRMGYSVALNDPFKGAALVARHGRPREGRHSLQIEVNRRLYMDETSLERNDGFGRLRANLGRLAAEICAYARGRA